MAKAAALELAKSSIRVDAIAPGLVKAGLLDRVAAGKRTRGALQSTMNSVAPPLVDERCASAPSAT